MTLYKSFPTIGQIVVSITLLLIANLIHPSSALAKATVTHSNYAVPVDEVIYSDCASEPLHFVGEFHVTEHTTVDENGTFHSTFVGNDHHVSAVGLTTGATYRRVGVTHESVNIVGQRPYEINYTNSFSFIGQGVAANTIEIDIVRMTIDEDGGVSIVFENRILECK